MLYVCVKAVKKKSIEVDVFRPLLHSHLAKFLKLYMFSFLFSSHIDLSYKGSWGDWTLSHFILGKRQGTPLTNGQFTKGLFLFHTFSKLSLSTKPSKVYEIHLTILMLLMTSKNMYWSRHLDNSNVSKCPLQ